MVQPQDSGVFFTGEQITIARDNRDREPFKSAWELLYERQPASPLEAAQLYGLRWRFDTDAASGEQAAADLQALEMVDTPYLDSLMTAVVMAQCYALLRDVLTFSQAAQAAWRESFSGHAGRLNQLSDDTAFVERIWLAALNTVTGIVLEDERIFQAGVAVYRQVIHDAIHPEGYIPAAVNVGDGQGIYRQLLAVKGLILIAEAASHAGVDLWLENNRGVSVVTAATYLMYYYFFPEKWRWDDDLDTDSTQALFRQHSGVVEMLNRRFPSKLTRPILDDLRPIYDISGGGLTTLTHALPKRGLFG